jgi:hypothetical protein
MTPLQYRGPAPANSNASVLPKSQADSMFAALEVTQATINAQIATYLSHNPLAPVSYFIAQNALIAQQSAVTTADGAYAPTSLLNADSGVAGLDSSGNLLTAQVNSSAVITNRIAKSYSVGAVSGSAGILGGTVTTSPGATGVILINGSYEVTTSGAPYPQLAQLEIPDPGWPWVPLCSGLIMGDSSASTPAPLTRSQGTGNCGMVLVTALSALTPIYGIALCADSYYTDTYPIQPYAAPLQTPTSVPALTGPQTLAVWGTCWNSAPYTFYEENFVFSVLVTPAE